MQTDRDQANKQRTNTQRIQKLRPLLSPVDRRGERANIGYCFPKYHFTDDSKLFMEINNYQDAMKLKECIENLEEWQKNNNMCFNTTKFYVLKFGSKEEFKSTYNKNVTYRQQTTDKKVNTEPL